MSVGGRVAEITRIRQKERDLLRLVVKDTRYRTSTVVYAEPCMPHLEPEIGSEVWWQGPLIFYDGDHHTLVRVGTSGSDRLDRY